MNSCFDLDCLLGTRPKVQRNNGRFVKGMIPHNKGKKMSEWMPDGRKRRKVRNRLVHTGNPNLPGWNKKPIIGIKEGKEYWFKSAQAAAESLGLIRTNISKCCRGERKRCGGFNWKFA